MQICVKWISASLICTNKLADSGGMEISLKAGASLSSARLLSFCYDSAAAAAAGEDDGQRDDSRKGFIQEKTWRDKLQ